MFNVLIKDTNTDKLKFLKVKKPILKEETTQVEDENGNLVDQTTQVETGEFETIIFETDDKSELEAKCIELLQSYSAAQIVPVENLKYELGINWL